MAVKELEYFKKPVFISVLICLIVFYVGHFDFSKSGRNRFLSLLSQNKICLVKGTILSSPVKTSNGSYYSVLFETQNVKDSRGFESSASGRIKVYIPSEFVEAYYPGKLYSDALSVNSSGSDSSYLYETGAVCTFKGRLSDKGFYVKDSISVYWNKNLSGKLAKFRALCRLQFKRLMYGWGKAGGLLLALLCGAREYTDSNTAENFRRAGLSHILALSGMHLSMFSAIAIFFGNKAKIKKLTFILRIIALILFVWFAGFSPSLLRAFLCTMLCVFASIAGTTEPDMIIILCCSFLLQSIISPDDIYSSAFILSYGALAGILIFGRFFTRAYAKIFPIRIAAPLSASTGAQTVTAPVSLKLFGSFSPIGIVASVVVSPFVTIFIYSGLILILLCLIFPVLVTPSGIFINLQYTIINYIVKIFSLVPNWSI